MNVLCITTCICDKRLQQAKWIYFYVAVWETKDGKKEKEVKKEREPSQSMTKEETEKLSTKKDNGPTKGTTLILPFTI